MTEDLMPGAQQAAPVQEPGVASEQSQLRNLVADVHRVLTEHLHIDAPSPDTDIVETGALDSFTMVELLVTLEEKFGVDVPIEELEIDHFRSARSIAILVIASPAR